MFLLAFAALLAVAPPANVAPPARDAPPANGTPPVPSAPGDAAPAMSRDQAAAAVASVLRSRAERARSERAAELKSGVIAVDGARMPIWAATYGQATKGELRPVWISMHGGGGAPAAVNDQQWENQKRLYRPAEGIYVAPRAPSDEWNLWHRAPVDRLFARLIEDLVICERADPDRVYLMGYSAGGDGVYQLAPRMADRFAAASMMAGHPNEARPDGLRNLPFAIHVGERDAAFGRNAVAAEWGRALDALAGADPGAYVHVVEIHRGKGHWMDREDATAVPWMARFTRDPRPRRIVWVQDDVTHPRFYWLENPQPAQGQRVVAEREGQEIRILEAPSGIRLRVLLDDGMCDLDRPVRVVQAGTVLFEGKALRLRAVVERVLADRHDPRSAFCAEIEFTTCTSAGG